MGTVLMLFCVLLPPVAGALRWSWLTIWPCGLVATVGFFLSNPGTLERVHGRGDLLYVVPTSLLLNSVVCAALFGLGHLLGSL